MVWLLGGRVAEILQFIFAVTLFCTIMELAIN